MYISAKFINNIVNVYFKNKDDLLNYTFISFLSLDLLINP